MEEEDRDVLGDVGVEDSRVRDRELGELWVLVKP